MDWEQATDWARRACFAQFEVPFTLAHRATPNQLGRRLPGLALKYIPDLRYSVEKLHAGKI